MLESQHEDEHDLAQILWIKIVDNDKVCVASLICNHAQYVMWIKVVPWTH